jgi:hypothetical protein
MLSREDLTTAAGKRRFTTAALDVVRYLTDSVEREYYVTKIASLSDSSVDALKEKLATVAVGKVKKVYKDATTQTEIVQDPSFYQDNLLSVALIDGATHDLFRSVDPGNIYWR